MTYPKNWKWESERQHLLFDFGYSYALLSRCQKVLANLAEFDQESADLVAEIQALKDGRQQTTTEVYDAADEAFKEINERRSRN